MNKLSGENRKIVLTKLLESPAIIKLYELYIIKEIPYEKWVEDNMDRLLKERERIRSPYLGGADGGKVEI